MTTTAHCQRICCIPGDLLELTESPEKKLDDSDAPTMMMAYDDEDCVDITLGPGLRQSDDKHVLAIQAGIIRHQQGNRWWVDSRVKRYTPAVGDPVVGIVRARLGESFLVDIGCAQNASLPYLSFENASRRNRPNLKIGQLVYAKVAVAHKHLEPELTCVNATTNKADGFGELKNGMMIRCFSSTARALLQRKHPILEFLGDQFAYELAVGMNGRVWVHSRRAADTVVVANAIVQTERIAAGNVAEMKRVVMTLLHSAAMDVSTA